MENKTVGWLILGISVGVIGIILLFNQAMLTIVNQGCPVEHLTGVCPAYQTIQEQTYLSFAIVGILVLVGLVLIFSHDKTKVIVRQVKDRYRDKPIDVSTFTPDEKKLLGLLQKERAALQADIIDKTGFAKVKVTRILDKFESKGLIERKRRGMQNLIVLLTQ